MKIPGKINITFVTHYTQLYGANRSLLNLIEGLKLSAKNADMQVIVPAEGQLTEKLKEKQIDFFVIPFYNEIFQGKRRTHLQKGVGFCKDLVKFLVNWILVVKHSSIVKQADIVHTNSSATFFGAYLARWTNKKHVWHIREFGWEDYAIKYNFGYSYFRYWLQKANASVAISHSVYQERLNNVNVRNKAIIYNGIFFRGDLRASVKPTPAGTDKLVYAIIGVITEGKRQLEAIQAFQLLVAISSNFKLLIVGNGTGEYEKRLRSYVDENNLGENIHFPGYIENISDIYAQVDCLLMCSHNEALGRVTIEALGYGIPVIGYKNAGTAEIIREGYNGLFYQEGPNNLFLAMKKFSEDEVLRQELVSNTRKSVERFTIETFADQMQELYRSII